MTPIRKPIWRRLAPCANCPFSTSAAGTHLRESLGAGRMAEIKDGLRHDGHFLCHKTTRATGNGTNQVCAGSLAWQKRYGYSNQYERIAERLDAIRIPRTITFTETEE